MDIDLDKSSEITKKLFESFGWNIIECRQLNSNGRDFVKVIVEGLQGEHRLTFEQYYWIVNEKLYVLTFTCATSEFAQHKYTGKRILNSFRLK